MPSGGIRQDPDQGTKKAQKKPQLDSCPPAVVPLPVELRFSELLAGIEYATSRGKNGILPFFSKRPSPRLLRYTILRWWLPHIDGAILTKLSRAGYWKNS
jgi:hypothetical protein